MKLSTEDPKSKFQVMQLVPLPILFIYLEVRIKDMKKTRSIGLTQVNTYLDLFIILALNEWFLIEVKMNSNIPCPRSGHSMVAISLRLFVCIVTCILKIVQIYGGRCSTGDLLQDLWLFDLPNSSWRQIDTNFYHIPSIPRYKKKEIRL